MSCTVSRESRVMLAELLAEEKEDTRKWLRDEMDRLVDSMFHRLTHKLMMNVDWDRSDNAKVVNLFDHVESLIPLPSNSLNPTASQLIIFQQQHDPNVIHYQLSNDSFPIGIDVNEPMIHCNANIQSNHHQQSELEFQSLVQQQQQSNLIFANAQVNFDLHLNEPPLNESVLKNEEFNENFDGYEAEEEGECYCDECVGVIEIDQEQVEVDDDDSGSVQLIEDDDQEDESESTLPVKRPRMDPTQPNNDHQQSEVVRLSPTDEAHQPNQANKHYITVHLQCPLSNCPATFPEDQLAQHLLDAHSIGPFRCLVKDCKQAFDDTAFLKQHRLQSHKSITEWHCDACDHHYPSYDRLSLHCQQHHQHGLFGCSFPACTFTGEYRQKVSTHYSKQHRQPTKCAHCHYATADPSNLKRHERGHLGIKPYRCNLFHCDYSSSSQADTLKHIRTHLARCPIGSVPNGTADPKGFLEIRNDLL